MKVDRVFYEENANLGDYETVRVRVEVVLNKDDDPEQAIESAKDQVKYALFKRKEERSLDKKPGPSPEYDGVDI